MGKAGKRTQRRLHARRLQAERQRRRGGAGGVLGVVQPTQRADAADLGDQRGLSADRAQDALLFNINPVGQRLLHRNPDYPFAGFLEFGGDGSAPFVIDADDRDAVLGHAGDQARLHRRVVLHRAVAVEMIFAEVDQDADRGIERGRKIDLIRGTLDDMDAARLRRFQR